MSGSGLLPQGWMTGALTRAKDWLVEPVESDEAAPGEPLPATPGPLFREPARPVVAVVALAPRCGASTLARWLAAELAGRDPEGAAIVLSPLPSGAGSLRGGSAARLGRALAARDIGPVRAAGRLCLLDASEQSALTVAATCLAPLVVDGGYGASAASLTSIADHVVLVAGPSVEPSLAAVMAASLARIGPEPFVVVNRVDEPGRWEERPGLLLPSSRLAARRAAAGRPAGGALGAGVTQIADVCEGSVWG